MSLERVYQPIQVGPIEIPNRIVRAAHGTFLATPTDLLAAPDLIAYHLARAKAGVGLTVLDAVHVHPSSPGPMLSDDRLVDSYQKLVSQIRPHGMRLFQQLFHQGHERPLANGAPPWAVSTVPSSYGVVGTPMNKAQIDEIIAAYAAATRRCRQGGLDGVEVNGTYLPTQFLSPIINNRTDEYGGCLENRMRFTRELMHAIREEAGNGLAIGIRWGASHVPGQMPEELVTTMLQALEQDGLIDYVSLVFGDHYSRGFLVAGMEEPAGYQLESASRISAAISVPTMVNGRIRTLAEAERVLVDGIADMVSLVRPLIADPDLITKTREGRTDEIRPCISCNQGCFGRVRMGMTMRCAVNPAVGFERSLAEDLILPVDDPRYVVVVGGGPAGLEAARIAARMGHRITLFEAESALGGMLNVARLAPLSGPIGELADWLARQVVRAGVDVRMGKRVSAEEILACQADAVIIATGSTPRLNGFQPSDPVFPVTGMDQAHVLTPASLLLNGLPSGAGTAVILDGTATFQALEIAEFLVSKGIRVTFVTSQPMLSGSLVFATARDESILKYLHQGDFTPLVNHRMLEITATTCRVQPRFSRHSCEIPADIVIPVMPNEPNRGLYDQLLMADQQNLLLVGDAASPRDFEVAIAEGHRAARSLFADISAPRPAAEGSRSGTMLMRMAQFLKKLS